MYLLTAAGETPASLATSLIVIDLLAVVVEATGLARCREAGRPPILLSNKSKAFVAHYNGAFGCTSLFANISFYELISCIVLTTHC